MSDPSTPLPLPDAFHVQAALGWLELGNAAEAKVELASLPDAHREHPDALEVWWKVFAESKEWARALEIAEKLVLVAPDRVSAWVDRSYALHELKRTREAYELLSPLVEKFRAHFVIPYNLACYQCQMGNYEAAMRWLRCAIEASNVKTIRNMAMEDADLAPLHDKIIKLGQP